jgi:hypothetical protein
VISLSNNTRLSLLAGLAIGACAPGALAQFQVGDVYLGSILLPVPGHPCGIPTVLRFVPPQWTTPTVLGYPAAGFSGRMAFDAYRQAIILGYDDGHLEKMDAVGVRTQIAPAGTAKQFAPSADGHVYFWNPPSQDIRYLDSANVIHPLLDLLHTGTYHFPISVDALYCDPITNGLFFATQLADDRTQVTRIPLEQGGGAVQAAALAVVFDASPGQNYEKAVGFSRGPNGNLFLAIDDNGGGEVARMQLINATTCDELPFATCNYTGVSAEVAGCYVPSLNMALMYDSFAGGFRGYSQGGHGAGSSVAVPALANTCFSGAATQMLVIDPYVPHVSPADVGGTGGVTGGDGHLDNNDFVVFIDWFFTGDSRADRGSTGGVHAPDGHFDNNDFIVFIDQFFAG